jgi:hypothetical protein
MIRKSWLPPARNFLAEFCFKHLTSVPKDMEKRRAASISCRHVKPLGLGLGKPGTYGASMIRGQSKAVITKGLFAALRIKSSMFTIETVKCAFYLLVLFDHSLPDKDFSCP